MSDTQHDSDAQPPGDGTIPSPKHPQELIDTAPPSSGMPRSDVPHDAAPLDAGSLHAVPGDDSPAPPTVALHAGAKRPGEQQPNVRGPGGSPEIATVSGEALLDPDNVTLAWDMVSQQVEALVTAWESGARPSRLDDYLPEGPQALRRLTLVELIKVDMMYRLQRHAAPRRLEDYLREFPDLAAEGDLPVDLIYEEYYLRKQAGESVKAEEYYQRFPNQAAELGRLLGFDGDPRVSTALVNPERMDEIEAGQSLDDFDLVARVGKGAFATVFLARQRSMQRMVALKISADRGNEPQTMAQLDHPHIVRVYDQRLLPDRNLRLLYMQYVPGGTLQRVVEQVRRMHSALRNGQILLDTIDEALADRGETPPGDSRTRRQVARSKWPEVVCWLGSRLAAALDYAHQRGVLHRDLKPANVLVAADGTPKLADFNISYSSKVEGASPAAYFGGSLAYMSPEQLEAFSPSHDRTPDELDGASDIYSLGVMLWELVTGRRPFRDESLGGDWSKTLASMIQTRRAGMDPALTARLPRDCPPGLADVLLKCLAPDPSRRFATAGQLARQLELCLQPGVQQLLRPRTGDWRPSVRRFPFMAVLLAGLIPNIVTSRLNIEFNWQLIESLPEAARSAARAIFRTQILTINPVAYTLGVGLLMALAWPIVTGVRQSRPNHPPSSERLAALRARCLKMGDWVAWVTAALWAISGLVFPLWLHLQSASGQTAVSYYVHFLPSQVLCGLIAASMSFFLVTFVNVRAYYPLFLQPELDDQVGHDDLRRLGRRTSIYFLLAVSVPLLAVFAVVLLAKGEDRIPILVLGAVGLVGFFLAYYLSRQINHDVDALAIAAAPSRDAFGASSETLDTFWGASR